MTPQRPGRAGLLGHLSRVTTSGSFIPEVDGLRFVAILAVILFHLAINLGSRNPDDYGFEPPAGAVQTVLRSGDFGVQLFFIVSGFVLALPFARHHLLGTQEVSLKAYFLRRVTRLEPPYIIAMIGVFLLLVVAHGRSPAELLPHLLASLAYCHSLVYGQDSVINNVAWSLEVEIQFYLLVPLLTLLFAIRQTVARRATMVAVIVLTSAVGPVLAGQSAHLTSSILRFLQYFLVGFLLVDLMLGRGTREPRPRWLWDLVVLGSFPLVIYLHSGASAGPARGDADMESIVTAVILPWLCFAAYLGVFRGRLVNAVLTNRWITTTGGMCYSIYLLHNVFLNNVLWATKGLAPTGNYLADFAMQAFVMVPMVLVVSSVFFVLVERPCMDKNWPMRARARLRRQVRVS